MSSGDGWEVREEGGMRHLYVERGGWTSELTDVVRTQHVESVATALSAGADGSPLADLPLRKLAVVAENAQQLTFVGRMGLLEELRLGVRTRGRADLDFSGLTRLRAVGIDGHPDLEALAGLSQLQRLRIDGSRWVDLEPLRGLASLRSLELASSRTLQTLTGIEQLTELTQLGVYLHPKLADISAVADLLALRRIDFEGCGAVDSLERVANLGELRSLAIDNSGDVRSLGPLAGLTLLESFFAVASTNVLDGDLTPLLSLPELRRFGMRSRRHYRPTVAEVHAHVGAR